MIESHDFKIGDVVVLESGGPAMTVHDLGENSVAGTIGVVFFLGGLSTWTGPYFLDVSPRQVRRIPNAGQPS